MNINVKKLLLTSAGFLNPKIGEEFLELVNKIPKSIKTVNNACSPINTKPSREKKT